MSKHLISVISLKKIYPQLNLTHNQDLCLPYFFFSLIQSENSFDINILIYINIISDGKFKRTI